MSKENLKVASVQLNPVVGGLKENAESIKQAYQDVLNKDQTVDLVVTPEASLTGYPLDDLVWRPGFLDAVERTLESLKDITKNGPQLLVGAPMVLDNELYNCAVQLANGEIRSITRKRFLPSYGPFHEQRYFAKGNDFDPIDVNGHKVGVLVCRDFWEANAIKALKHNGAESLIAMNASPFAASKADIRLSVARDMVRTSGLPLLYNNMLGGQDEFVFDGGSFALDNQGQLISVQPQWRSDSAIITLGQQAERKNIIAVPNWSDNEMEQIYEACVLAMRDYAHKNGFKSAVIGVSGGIDSALCIAIACDALGPENVHGLMLPHEKYTSNDSLDFSKETCAMNGCHFSDDLTIGKPYQAMKNALEQRWKTAKVKETYENVQARLRTLFLYAVSNEEGHLVINTSNKSEVAMGHSTFYGDTGGGFAPIKDVWKLDVYKLAKWRNQNRCKIGLGVDGIAVHPKIIAREPTPELGLYEIDLDILPPYTTLDPILKALVEEEASVSDIVRRGFDREMVSMLAYHIKKVEFKRFQTPPGPILSERSFASRDRMYPITSHYYPRFYQ